MKQVDEELDRTTNLAFERTRLAQERTLLAWVRTAIALISFGFTIYAVFALESGAGHRFAGPRPYLFPFALVAIGLISLVLATIQHLRDQKTLRSIDPTLPAGSQAMMLGALVALLGLLAFGLLLSRALT